MTSNRKQPRFFVLVVDDDPEFGEVARRLDGPLCEVRWVTCAGVEAEVRRRRPDYLIGDRVELTPEAASLYAARSAEAGRKPVVFCAVPAAHIDHVVRGFLDEAVRREAMRPTEGVEA